MYNKDFNKKVKELRVNNNLSQEELASLSGLSVRTIQRIENGDTNPIGDTKRKIISVLESFPNRDFSNNSEKLKESSFFKKLKFAYIVVVLIFAILGILIGMLFHSYVLFISGILIELICLTLLTISTIYHIKNKGFKKGAKYLAATIIAIIVVLFPLGMLLSGGKGTQQTHENGKTTTIKRSHFGKPDTTIVYESIDDLRKKDSSYNYLIRERNRRPNRK